MGFAHGDAREQTMMFPPTLEELVPQEHVCRVIDAFVSGLRMTDLQFVRAEPAETGRPGYDPRDLLKLYLYGYLHQIRSSRRLEAECKRNVEVMWLLGRLQPDHKSIAEFRRLNREAVSASGAQLIRLARKVGLIRGEWVAIDGSKFRAVSSAESVHERENVQRYLDELEKADQQEEVHIDPSAVAAALKELELHPEPDAHFMRTPQGKLPAYNVQVAVDAEHAIIVAQQVTTERNDMFSLLPMAVAAQEAVGAPAVLQVVADTGYSNAVQVEACEERGILAHVPPQRAMNNQGDGTLYDRRSFTYDEVNDSFRCPAGQTLRRGQVQKDRKRVAYQASAEVCAACPLKSQCTRTRKRTVYRHLYERTLERMRQRTTAEAMRLRRSVAEHPFATLKYRIFGHPKFLLRGRAGAATEISFATMVYNLKRMIRVLGLQQLKSEMVLA